MRNHSFRAHCCFNCGAPNPVMEFRVFVGVVPEGEIRPSDGEPVRTFEVEFGVCGEPGRGIETAFDPCAVPSCEPDRVVVVLSLVLLPFDGV